jgi:hypothetical protein
MHRFILSVALVAFVGCSREVTVESDGYGGGPAADSTGVTSSATTDVSSSTGLACIVATGECEANFDPTPGVACKTNGALAAPDGTCDGGGNCCR